MSLSTQPYKGTRDFYPEDKRIQKYMFGKLREAVERFGYQEYDTPMLEPFELYAAKSGEEIVNEQLYSFEDKGGRKLAVRPEMTPSASRMIAARRQELAYPVRWYSIPNLWRYERPQAGRLREHWQLNVDIFGETGVVADAEIVQVADAILKSFGAQPEMYKININSRSAMVEAMKAFSLEKNELKQVYGLIDKMPKMSDEEFNQLLVEKLSADKSKKILEYLNGDTLPENIKRLLELLKSAGVTSAVYDRSVVRGFEYYTDIVFEVFDTSPENARSMFGGGRYDGLVGMFGVEPVSGVGFGMGDVTLQRFLEGNNLLPKLAVETQAVAILIGDVYEPAQKVVAELRDKGLNVAVDASNRKLDAKIKAAAKAGVPFALFIGEQELKSGQLKLKNLATGQEKLTKAGDVVSAIKAQSV